MTTINGNSRNNTLTGTDGDDTIDGGSGSDLLFAGAGNDTIYDNDDDRDTVYGGAGNDVWIPSTSSQAYGSDQVYLEAGDDTAYLGWLTVGQNETIDGGTGVDTFNFSNFPNNTINATIREDGSINFLGTLVSENVYLNFENVTGNNARNTLTGNSQANVLDGGGNDDKLYGGAGDDTLVARDAQDSLFGGTGNDYLTILKDGDIGTLTADGGSDPADDDIDVLDLKAGIARGDWEGVRIYNTGGQLIYNSITPIPGQNLDTIPEDGRAELINGNDVVGRVNFREIEKVVICFTPDTMIATPRGEVRVADLKVGDPVLTRDNGMQTIAWIGQRRLTDADLQRAPNLRPVCVKAGAFGDGMPERDMTLSPNHRLLIQSPRAALLFAESEVLAPAKHLVGRDGIVPAAVNDVTYIHIMFARHEVILSDGLWTESFQPGDHSLSGIGDAQRAEILDLFPDLKTDTGLQGYAAARKAMKKHESRLLLN